MQNALTIVKEINDSFVSCNGDWHAGQILCPNGQDDLMNGNEQSNVPGFVLFDFAFAKALPLPLKDGHNWKNETLDASQLEALFLQCGISEDACTTDC